MPNLNVLIQEGTVCQCLRTKTLFYDDDPNSPAGSEGPFWCAHTQSVLGPDGRVADVESCRPGRGCCEIA